MPFKDEDRHMITPRYASSPHHVDGATTDELRSQFLIESLFVEGEFRGSYIHDDRMLVAGAVPGDGDLVPSGFEVLGTESLLEHREAGIINLGGPGSVVVDGIAHDLDAFDTIYVGRGSEVAFRGQGARFYLVSALAHTTYPTRVIRRSDVEPVVISDDRGAGARRLYRVIWGGGEPTCQLQMGFTVLEPHSVWNTLPPHLHPRRTEVYLYTDVPADARVMHFMGEPTHTRHLVVADGEAVIAPAWSIHMGAGTAPYSFIWAMAGENTDYGDTTGVPVTSLR